MASKTCSEGWTNERTARRRALHRCRALDAASAREDLARPHPGASDRTMADEERLRAALGRAVHVPGKAHGRLERHRPLRGDGVRSAAAACLFLAGRIAEQPEARERSG